MKRTALLLLVCVALSHAQETGGFVSAANGALTINQAPFRFGGTNSYALMLESHAAVDQVLQTAADHHFTVIRTWVFDEVASSSGNAFYLQNFSGGTPQYNDGANGLANVDYAVNKAGQLGIKLILTLANNWTDYGGMDQYVSAGGLQYHDQFFTDSTVRQWFKNWIGHVLNHVNTISGVAYRNDPAIMMWELANEPRCQGSGRPSGLPSSNSCNTQTLVSWINDIAGYIKTVDTKHLVAVGDEGFFCNSAGVPGSLNICGNTGVDSVAFGQTQNVDVIGFHLYPDTWVRDVAWADQYIAQHLASAKAAGKPVYMGEFGLLEGNVRNSAYQDFTNLVFQGTGSGALFWDIVPGQPPAANAEALASFDVQAGSPLLTTLGNFAQMMSAGQQLSFAPVAGNQWAQGFFNAPVTLYPLGNDIVYGGATVDPASIDLDPSTAGLQASVSVYGGSFAVVGQSVQFTPANGFNGTTQCSYTVADTKGNLSNVAYMSVTIAPNPTAVATLESFEMGTDGWSANAGSGAAGTVSQSSAFHTDGSSSLKAIVTGTGWFGATLASPVDLSGRPSMSVDVQFSAAGQTSIAFQSGPGSVWCQIAIWPTVPANTKTTVTIAFDQSQLTCYGGSPTYSNISTVWVWLGPGTNYIDNLRAAPATTTPPAPVLPTISSISNSASGQAGAGSGAYFSIYGSNFAAANSGILTWSGWVVNGNLPTSLGGVSVTIGGQAAYIYAVSPTQINALAPWLTAGPAQVVVTTQAGNSAPFPATAQTLQPALFTWGKYAVATRIDYSYVVPNGTLSIATTAAKAGDWVILWGTGFGVTQNAVPIGQEVPPASYTVPNVSATLGTTAASVYEGVAALAPGLGGVYQVAMQVPSGMASGTYDLVVTVNGVKSPAVSFAVQ